MELSIEEVDAKIRIGKPSSSLPAYIAWVVTGAYWVIGTCWMIMTIRGHSELVAVVLSAIAMLAPTLLANMPLIVSYITMLFGVIFVSSFILILLIRKLARIVLIIVVFLSIIFNLAVGVIIMIFANVFAGAFMLIVGIIMLVLTIKYFSRVKFTGRLMEMSAAVLLREKGTISATVISMIINTYTLISMIFTSIFVGDMTYKLVGNIDYAGIAVLISIFLGLWSVAFVSTFFNGVIVGITHDWYRSPQVDVASFNRGLKRALRVQGGLAIYAFIMSILRMLVEYAKSKKGVAASIVTAILGITEEVIRFLTFYMVPAMVIREVGFKDGFKDSVHKLRDLFIETIISQIGFGKVALIFTVLYLTLLGSFGYIIGAYVMTPIFLARYNISAFAVGVMSGVIYIIVGLVPASVIFGTLTVVFNAMLYEFGIDLEFAKRGETLPKRMPKDVEQEFIKVLEERGIRLELY